MSVLAWGYRGCDKAELFKKVSSCDDQLQEFMACRNEWIDMRNTGQRAKRFRGDRPELNESVVASKGTRLQATINLGVLWPLQVYKTVVGDTKGLKVTVVKVNKQNTNKSTETTTTNTNTK